MQKKAQGFHNLRKRHLWPIGGAGYLRTLNSTIRPFNRVPARVNEFESKIMCAPPREQRHTRINSCVSRN